jgi:hypothetical protein
MRRWLVRLSKDPQLSSSLMAAPLQHVRPERPRNCVECMHRLREAKRSRQGRLRRPLSRSWTSSFTRFPGAISQQSESLRLLSGRARAIWTSYGHVYALWTTRCPPQPTAITLAHIDRRLREVAPEGVPRMDFGGHAVILVGDFFQLSPCSGTS